jgi:GT2 family glycosyltransferase
MTLWICIPVFNRLSLTLRCLDSLRAQTYRDYRVIVCDDGSSDGTAEQLRLKHPEVTVLQGDGSLWWTGATNLCITHVLDHCRNNDAVVTLNNDLEVDADYLFSLADAAHRYPNTLIGSVSFDITTGNLIDPGFRHSWITSKSKRLDPLRDCLPSDPDMAEVTHLPGRGTLIPVKVLRHIGLFDFKHLPQYGADYDLSFRARRFGYGALIAYKAQVFSHAEETGLTKIREKLSVSSFYNYLTNRRSPANLKVRFWMAINNCPRWLLPLYLPLDIALVIGSYFKHHLWSRA